MLVADVGLERLGQREVRVEDGVLGRAGGVDAAPAGGRIVLAARPLDQRRHVERRDVGAGAEHGEQRPLRLEGVAGDHGGSSADQDADTTAHDAVLPAREIVGEREARRDPGERRHDVAVDAERGFDGRRRVGLFGERGAADAHAGADQQFLRELNVVLGVAAPLENVELRERHIRLGADHGLAHRVGRERDGALAQVARIAGRVVRLEIGE